MGRAIRSGAILVPVLAAIGLIAGVPLAGAQEVVGIPSEYQIGFQSAQTPSMEDITWLHNDILMPIITVITLFVLALLLFVMVRFNSRTNPNPSRTTHNTLVEVAWTIVPIIILVVIAVPSFRMLYAQQTVPEADMTIKAVGSQWYWSYEYPDHDNIAFDSIMIEEDELKEGQPRLLAVDNPVVVPAGKVVRVQVTANDVIHDWAVPAFGIKVDAIPGRLNESWFKVDRPGIYYGQCSELCGIRHAFMPIEVRVLSQADFDAWLDGARDQFASAPRTPDTDRTDDGNPRTAALAVTNAPTR